MVIPVSRVSQMRSPWLWEVRDFCKNLCDSKVRAEPVGQGPLH